jgi:ABC-type branched-subunit amino acid transport system ATPase component
LRTDNWDDYHFKTMFHVSLHLGADRVLDLEQVKILVRGQPGGRTPMPDQPFTELDDSYCSLGQAYSYYETLHKAGPNVYQPFLVGLRDLVYSPEIHAAFADEEGFETSLLRFDGASRALADGPALFATAPPEPRPKPSLSFDYKPPGVVNPIQVEFGDGHGLPDRVCVLIGYNGTGKTQLLGKLAHVASAGRQDASDREFMAEFGFYVNDRPEFGAVIAVSYSAFDAFALPSDSDSNRTAARNYTYCGLRQITEDGVASTLLKGLDDVANEFHEARRRALGKERAELLVEATAPLLNEPSFRMTADLPAITASSAEWREAFGRLSAGHKIVLNIAVQLCANLERRSLLLLDEPELHLHPPLVAALLRSIGKALDSYDAFGLVATHSPVVLQEVPSRNVIVLRKALDVVRAEEPDIETFAENIGLLTRHVFNLDSHDTDYQAVLAELARTHTLEEIEALFAKGMSSQARSLVLSFHAAQE